MLFLKTRFIAGLPSTRGGRGIEEDLYNEYLFWVVQTKPVAFEIASAPRKFQRVMDDLFRDLPWVNCYLDDILEAASSKEENDLRVVKVLKRLQKPGIRLSKRQRGPTI